MWKISMDQTFPPAAFCKAPQTSENFISHPVKALSLSPTNILRLGFGFSGGGRLLSAMQANFQAKNLFPNEKLKKIIKSLWPSRTENLFSSFWKILQIFKEPHFGHDYL